VIDEWDERQVCPDGACIGVIGKDGRCSVCGRAASSEGGAYRETALAVQGGGDAATDTEPPAASDDTPGDVAAGPETEWAGRKLCSDGACTGVIGPDGHCKQCGKAAA
jgi:hypothetical protein